mmetsp:Transcript_49817/g.154032  ORF Transcript_49817/g.154032 Transcript_49817/m.154032 type:complete len:229 (-) Transcript_49817:96-782(-)
MAPVPAEGARRRERRRCAPTTPAVAAIAAVLAGAWMRWQGSEDFATMQKQRRRNQAPYGRIGGRPIIPNPEAEKFPAGVPRDEDGFPVITLREQYETNLTMYVEGLGPYPGPPPDFSGDWDYVPPDPEDADFDPSAPLPPPPPDAPEELMSLQPPGAIVWPEKTADEPVPETGGRQVAAAPEPVATSPLPADLGGMRVQQLKELLEERGLPCTGTKAALVERLRAHGA